MKRVHPPQPPALPNPGLTPAAQGLSVTHHSLCRLWLVQNGVWALGDGGNVASPNLQRGVWWWP